MESDRRSNTRRSADERIAILEDRYGSLNERVMALEEILTKIDVSVDRMATEIAATRKEFTGEITQLRQEVSINNDNIRKDLAPITEIQIEARAAFRFLRKFGLWVVLPTALLYVSVSGIPLAEDIITILVKAMLNGLHQ